jgi:hypothetical protein
VRVLDGVCAGFIERVAGSYVGANLFIGVVAHGNVGNAEIGQDVAVAHSKQGNPGVDLMRASAQASQHGYGFVVILGFAEDVESIHHGGIGREDDPVCVRFDGACLFFCKP